MAGRVAERRGARRGAPCAQDRLRGRRVRAAVAGDAASEEQAQPSVQSVQEELERQLESFSYADFDAHLSQSKLVVHTGERVTGHVLRHEGTKGALVDIGGKTPAYVRAGDATAETHSPIHESLPRGEAIDFLVVDNGNRHPNNRPRLSRRHLIIEESWDTLEEAHRNGEIVSATVTGTNRGGALTKVKGVGGFIPSSHMLHKISDDLLGEELDCTIMEADRARSRLILSNRYAKAKQSGSEFSVGDLVHGKVVAIKPYGAFVDAGQIAGLLHQSQISAQRVPDVTKVFSVGDEVKCIVMSYDPEKSRLSLSTRKLESNPGDMLNDPGKVQEQAEEKAAEYKKMLSNIEAHTSGLDDELNSLLQAARPEDSNGQHGNDNSSSD